MTAYTICLIEGDGIGREVVAAGRLLLEALPLDLCFTEASAGWATFEREGVALPEATVAAAQAADATLFGAVSSPLSPVQGYSSPIVGLRRRLGLYANLRPTQSMPIPSSQPGINMIIVRENSEGLYAGRERCEDEDTAITERVITRSASERITRMACELARQRRRQLTIVHKANVLKATCGLFRQAAMAVADTYTDVTAREMLVDNCAMQLIINPAQFDVIVTTNLFGDILSDEAAALVGGLGLAPSGNIGDDHAVFEPVHGSAPDIAGTGKANPLATFGAVAMMLDWLGEMCVAETVRQAIDAVLRQGPLTPDLGGAACTDDVTQAVISRVGRR